LTLQELQAVDSDDLSGLKRKQHLSNKLVIVSDEEDESDCTAKHDDNGKCNGVTSMYM